MTVPTFEFSTLSYPTEFIVVSFIGNERISRLFRYEIELKAVDSIDIDEDALIEETAVFRFIDSNGSTEINGVMSRFEYLRHGAGYHYYRATLVAEAWRETLGVDFEIFLQQSPKEIIEEEIADARLNADAASIGAAVTVRDFTCQYNESNFAFISRIAERNGIYYYFDHGQGSKMIFADDAQYPVGEQATIDFDGSAAGDAFYQRISDWRKTVNQTASYIKVRDFNADQPSEDIRGNIGAETGSGHALNLVDENVASSAEAANIAQIRFEELQSRRKVFEGQSGLFRLSPGHSFELSGHRKARFNDSYLVVGVIHEGNNVDAGAEAQTADKPYYRNRFRAIRSDQQFRPAQVTPRPTAISTQGRVFSEAGNPRIAERNGDGKYRVRFGFLDDEIRSRASHWLRMGQAAAGAEDTLDIPLKGGVEVQIGFENGNPDKPYIQAAMPNAEFPAFVTASNPNNALIATSGLLGLKAHGGWHRKVHVDEPDWPTQRFGNDPGDLFIMTDDGANHVSVGAAMTEEDEYSGNYNVDRTYGDTYVWVDGNTYKWDNERAYSFGNDYEEIHEDEDGIQNGEVFDMGPQMNSIGTSLAGKDYSQDNWEDGGNGLIEKTWGDKCEYHEGRAFAWSGGRGPGGSLETFSYGNGYTENLIAHGEGTSATLGYADNNNIKDLIKKTTDFPKAGISPPATGGMTGFLGSVTKGMGQANAWLRDTINVGQEWTGERQAIEGIGDARKLYPASTVVEKSYGGQYAYHLGFAVDIHQGHSVSHTYGDSEEMVEGDSESVVHGDSHETVIGVTNTFFVGAEHETKLSNSSSIQLGLKEELFVGGALEINGSVTIKLGFAGEFERDGFKLKSCDADLKQAQADISANLAKIKKVAADISKCDAKIDNNTIQLANGIADLQTYSIATK